MTLRAFTFKYPSIQNRLLTPGIVSNGDAKIEVMALWDTGATGTCISTDVVNQLSLIATGRQMIHTPSGIGTVNTYFVTVELPNDVVVPDVMVCDSEIGSQGIGMLIGMDIITKGDLAISNYDGKTVFTFRTPSVRVTDYAMAINAQNVIASHGRYKKKR